MVLRWLALVATTILAVVSGVRAARAQDFPDNPLIQRGIALYNDLEFEAAVDVLERALVRAGDVPEQKVAIFKYLALSCLVLGRHDDAREAFRQLLAIQPEFRLDPTLFSPEHSAFLERVRSEWEAQGRPGWVSPPQVHLVTIDHELPERVSLGESLDLHVAVEDPGGDVRRLVVAYRPAGQPHFVRMEAHQTPTGYVATIPGDRIGPPAVEYYFEALDEANNVVGRRGDERFPLRVPLAGEEVERPWYTSWWFWTIVGAVGVASAVAVPLAVVYGADDDDPGGSATVTIVLCDPSGVCGP